VQKEAARRLVTVFDPHPKMGEISEVINRMIELDMACNLQIFSHELGVTQISDEFIEVLWDGLLLENFFMHQSTNTGQKRNSDAFERDKEEPIPSKKSKEE